MQKKTKAKAKTNPLGTYNDNGFTQKRLLILCINYLNNTEKFYNKFRKELPQLKIKPLSKQLQKQIKQINSGTYSDNGKGIYNDKGIKIKYDIQSQQIESPNKPYVDLKVGDFVELKKDGIYFTRKIKLPSKKANLQSVFEGFIKRQNNIKQALKT